MGGRGTFAAGNNVAYTYETVDFIEDVKMLKGMGNEHSLPASSHSSNAYIKLKPDGTFHEMRIYDKNHILTLEIAYHPEPSLTGDRKIPVLHYHMYSESFSKSKTGNFERTKAKPLTMEMKKKYEKYFKGVKCND